MKKIYFILFFFFCFVCTTFGQPTKVNWRSIEFADAQINKNPNQKILLFFYTSWCGYCKLMLSTTFEDPEVIDYLNQNYIAVKINGEEKKEIEFQGKKYSSSKEYNTHKLTLKLLNGEIGYPSFLILKGKKPSNKFMGYIKNPKNFLGLLKSID